MRRARSLRVTPSRDLYIFCAAATRPSPSISSPSSSSSINSTQHQRRRLNSSRRDPQYASEGQLFKPEDAPAPPRRLTQAEKMRKMMEASRPAPPPPHAQAAYSSQNQRQSATSQSKSSTTAWQPPPRQPLPQRRPSDHAFGGQNRGRSRDRSASDSGHYESLDNYAPRRPDQYNSSRGRDRAGGPTGNSRYQVNIDSRGPPVGDTSMFGTGQLRRRNEPSARFAEPPRASDRSVPRTHTPASTTKLDQAELDQLLGNTSNINRQSSPRPYTPLSRDTSVRTQCMHCGRQDHLSTDCPTKPVLRQEPRQVPRQKGAVDEFFEKNKFEATQSISTEVQERQRQELDRRRARFIMDDEAPQESSNRYEQAERRGQTNYERRRRRVTRYEGEEDEDDSYVDKAELKRERKAARKRMQEEQAANAPTPVSLPQYISVANLASLLRIRVEDFVAKLEDLGFEEVQTDHILNAEHAGLVAQEYNFEPVVEAEDEDLHAAPALPAEEYAKLPARPPVVTIMGHVDHGKTTILDYMRSTSVAASEFGGITQHIGAFSVPLASGKKITYLDTPGHSAFETMRARGANVTDIVVLVVAADDSVMPQTVEAIKHAQNAKVPIIVAINKIDLQQSDPEAVKLDLGRHGIEVEDFGGDIQAIPVSGLTGQGIPELEEAIVTLSEMLDHRADPHTTVEGWVLESSTKKSGKVATVLVRSGTLRVGDIIVAGTTWARVRTLKNEAGMAIEEVGPGMPVEVEGWREQPIAGDEVLQAADEHQGQAVAETRADRVSREQMAKDMDAINESRRLETERRHAEKAAAKASADGADPNPAGSIATSQKPTGPEVIPFIVKGDVSGSVEAVIDSVSALGNAEISTRVLRHGVGAPSEFDVQHAASASGHIINFNTAVPAHISSLAEENGVRIFDENIIYRVVENVKSMLEARLAPRITQKVTGEVEIALVFEIGLGGRKKLRVAGSKVRNGVVIKGSKAKVLRGDDVVYDGTITSLKHVKKDVMEMRKDSECGIAFDGWDEFAPGDKVQCYEEESHKRTL
ncbi:unnamed protein product [Periconia digitata]|uniref:Translation initiation factor IF-2, mitochondrial n=1 Tax=Periconia digitata TaxID=1303443 RepID=A0A9W4XVA8_9PLEO|nr:unnamed protein product [Periconia digitata]